MGITTLIILTHLAELVTAAFCGMLTFVFGIFFWINVENPGDQIVWTVFCGGVTVVAFVLTCRFLFLTQQRINWRLDRAAREETAAQLKAKPLTVSPYPFRTNQI